MISIEDLRIYEAQISNTERAIYIVAGVCAPASAFLLIIFIYVLVSNSRLKSQLNQMIRDTKFSKYQPQRVKTEPSNVNDNFSFGPHFTKGTNKNSLNGQFNTTKGSHKEKVVGEKNQVSQNKGPNQKSSSEKAHKSRDRAGQVAETADLTIGVASTILDVADVAQNVGDTEGILSVVLDVLGLFL